NDWVGFPDDLGSAEGFAAGTLSGSGGTGAGASIAVALIEDTTDASISGGTDMVGGDVTVGANTTESLPVYVGTAGTGGRGSLAGAIAYIATPTGTTADIAGAQVTSNKGNVGVTATDTTTVDDNVGTLAAAGGAGVGAAIDVLTSKDTVTADIGAGSSV